MSEPLYLLERYTNTLHEHACTLAATLLAPVCRVPSATPLSINHVNQVLLTRVFYCACALSSTEVLMNCSFFPAQQCKVAAENGEKPEKLFDSLCHGVMRVKRTVF